MPVKKDANGERSVEAEVEVPGTPEEVWRAIATGGGISSWFVPSTVEERAGGAVVCNFGPGMESVATIKSWDPPHGFVAEADGGPGKVATEWTVEACAGGNCVVRVAHRWFASTDDWDDQFEGHAYGWAAFLRILRLYLAHFRDQPSAPIQVAGFKAGPVSGAWGSLTGLLGLAGAVVGQRAKTARGAPALAGLVERLGAADHPELLLRLDEPAPGVAHLFAMPMGEQALLSVRLFLYGQRASNVAAEIAPGWHAFMNEHFPPLRAPGAP